VIQNKLDPGGIAAGGGAAIGTVTALGFLNDNAQAIGVLLTGLLVLASIVYWVASYYQKERAMRLSRDKLHQELCNRLSGADCPEEVREQLFKALDRRG
jgi:glucose-6-phosphate-specific signal transduction histidine kinase